MMNMADKTYILNGKFQQITCLALALSLTGCAAPQTGQSSGQESLLKRTFASDDPCADTARNWGLVVGTVLGGVIGKQLGDGKAAAVLGGVALGALAGGLIGADMDHKRCELSKIAKQYNLDVAFVKVDPQGDSTAGGATGTAGSTGGAGTQGMSMSLRDNNGDSAQFATNSDQLTPRAIEYFTAIAREYANVNPPAGLTDPVKIAAWRKTMSTRRLLLVGHTDDTGSSRWNADLSERRAKVVAAFMKTQGVPAASLYFQGAGEGYPVADNSTPEGRSQNRRVEFVEIYGEDNFRQFIEARKPRYEFYRSSTLASASEQSADSAPTSNKAAATPTRHHTGKTTAPASVAAVKPAPANASISGSPAKAAAPSPTAGGLPANVINFGGQPLTPQLATVNLGMVRQQDSGFKLIDKAYADTPFLARCDQDRPRVIGSVKALKDDREYTTNQHLQGLYGTTWHDEVNGHLIVLNKLSVLQDGTTPANPPELKVYTNYNPDKRTTAKPKWQSSPAVNTYQGSNGILYRVFAGGSQGMQCLDILFPSNGGFEAKSGKLVYGLPGALYVADFHPKMLK